MNSNLLGKDINTIEHKRQKTSQRRVGCPKPGHDKLKSLKQELTTPLLIVLITISTDVPCRSSCSTLKKSISHYSMAEYKSSRSSLVIMTFLYE